MSLGSKDWDEICKRRLFVRIPGWNALFLREYIMRLGIIGAGRVGTSFVLAMPSAVEGILCSTKEHTTQRAQSLQVKAYSDGADLLRHCDVLLLTVRDDVIGSVAGALAAALSGDDGACDTVILHCSGAMDLSSLAPLAALGFSVGSLHPLQSFAAPSGDLLRHIYMAVDGDDRAKEAALSLVKSLDSKPLFVPPEERVLYHAAACFCSNYVVTAVALGQRLMRRWTETDGEAAQSLMPLLKGTVGNLERTDRWQKALTGPVSRGDTGTVAKHLEAMPADLVGPYCAFSRAAGELSLENGTITENQYAVLKEILAMAEGVHE